MEVLIRRVLIASNVLVREGDEWVLESLEMRDLSVATGNETLTSSGLPIPGRIKDLISRRLDRLGEEARRVLISAAIVGVQFEFAILLEIVDVDEDTLLDHMDEAMREDIIEEVPGTGGELLHFKHNMVRSVLFSSINRRRRARVHRNISQAILGVHGSQNPDYWELLAFHFDRAKLYRSAIEYYIKSADRSQKHYIHQSARAYCDRLLEIIPEGEFKREEATGWYRDVYRINGLCFERTGDLDRAFDSYQKLIRLGQEEVDPATEGIGYYYTGGIHKDKGEFDSAMESFRKCLELLPETEENRYRRALTMGNIAGVFINLGNYQKALDLYSTVRKFMMSLANQSGIAMCNMNIGMVYYYFGQYEESFRWLNESIDLYKKADDPFRVAKGMVNLGGIYQARGEIEKAMSFNFDALKISRKIGDIYSVSAIQGNLGLYYHEKGEYQKSSRSFRESLRISREIGDRVGSAIALVNMANLMTDHGADDQAYAYYKDAVGISEEIGERWLKLCADHQFGEYFLLKNQLEEAQIKFHECYNEASQIGLQSLKLQCSADLAWIEALKGDINLAMENGQATLVKAEELGDSDALLTAQLRLGWIYLKAEQFSKACILSARGLKISRNRGHLNNEWRFLVLIGVAHLKQNRYRYAHRPLRKAVSILLAINKNIETELRKTFFTQVEVRHALEMLVAVCEHLEYRQEAATYKRFLEI